MPRGYIVDGQEGIKDPLGMSAVRLEVETHIVAGAATSVQNLSKCVLGAGVQIDEMVISSLAAAEATLTDTEKELGVLVADIGGGTTDIAIFVDGAVYHTAVLPVGGIKEKVLAARRVGIREVILPRQNEKNVNEDLSPELRGDLTIHLVSAIEEVLELALSARPHKDRSASLPTSVSPVPA